jgi:uncharacterized protein involved in exopolysaccharide biosynthesis
MEKPAEQPVPAPTKPQTLPPDVLAVAVFQPRRAAFSRRAITLYSIWAILIIVIGAEAGYLVSNLADEVYGARSEILHELDESRGTGFLREDRRLTTQLERIKSREVLAPVATASDMKVDELAAKVNPKVIEGSEVIRIEVTDNSREEAEKLTGQVTDEYLKVARDTNVDTTIAQFTEQMEAINGEIVTKTEQLSTAGGATLTRLQSELAALDDRKNSVQDQLDELAVQKANLPVITQLTKPYLLDEPVSPKPMKAAIAGGLAGFALVAAAATFLIRRHLADQRD